MDRVNGFIDRAKVVMTAAVTYISLATTIVTMVATQVVPTLPEDVGVQVAGYATTAVAFLLGVSQVIRRVTPVDAANRGILPVE